MCNYVYPTPGMIMWDDFDGEGYTANAGQRKTWCEQDKTQALALMTFATAHDTIRELKMPTIMRPPEWRGCWGTP